MQLEKKHFSLHHMLMDLLFETSSTFTQVTIFFLSKIQNLVTYPTFIWIGKNLFSFWVGR